MEESVDSAVHAGTDETAVSGAALVFSDVVSVIASCCFTLHRIFHFMLSLTVLTVTPSFYCMISTDSNSLL